MRVTDNEQTPLIDYGAKLITALVSSKIQVLKLTAQDNSYRTLSFADNFINISRAQLTVVANKLLLHWQQLQLLHLSIEI